eukprot:406743_1
MRGAMLCARTLSQLWMELCDDQFNDQTLIWLKRAMDLVGEAGLIATKQQQNNVKAAHVSLRLFEPYHLHYLLFDYANCLYEKLLSIRPNQQEEQWYYLSNLENDGACEDNECWHDWDPNDEVWEHYLMRRCMDVFKFSIHCIKTG